MTTIKALELKAFVPAKDFARSKEFYQDLGFEIPWSDERLAYIRLQNVSFLLQNFYVEEHARNFQMHLTVASADDCWKIWMEKKIAEKYGIYLSAPSDKPWGIRDFEITDPAGVLWRVGHNL